MVMKSKTLINQMKCSFESRSANEAFARMTAAGFVAALDPTVEELSDLKTAVSEAVTNAIVHGYPNRLGTVYIDAKIFQEEDRTEGGNGLLYWVQIRVRDKGCGIPDVRQAMEPLFTTCTTGERSGLGFVIMESFMDKVKVNSKIGVGTTVVLMKKIRSKGKEQANG